MDSQVLMQATPEQVAQSLRETEEYENLLDQVWAVLRQGGIRAYAKALKVLPEEDLESWENGLPMKIVRVS